MQEQINSFEELETILESLMHFGPALWKAQLPM